MARAPEVLHALNPWWGVRFFAEHNWHAVFVLGAVVLAVTGGEALYADMGHFGAKAIRRSWQFVVLPMLTLTYLGQGALVLRDPSAVSNPFYEAVPDWALYPMIVLATAATVIALAGADHRRLFGGQPSHAAGLYPAHAHSPHLALHDWSDLRAGGELVSAGAGGGGGDPVSVTRPRWRPRTASR